MDDIEIKALSERMKAVEVNTVRRATKSSVSTPKRLSFSGSSPIDIDDNINNIDNIDDGIGDTGLRFSDTSLNITASKPPIPRGNNTSSTAVYRGRSRSIETTTAHRHNQQPQYQRQWKRKMSHDERNVSSIPWR